MKNLKTNSNEFIDLELEKSILSSFFYNEDNFIIAQDYLSFKDFYDPFHKNIFKAIESCISNAEPIDQIFIKKYIKNDYNEDTLIDILSKNPVSNLKAYLKELRMLSIKREFLKISSNIAIYLENDDFIDKINSEIYKLSSDLTSGMMKHSKDVVKDLLLKYKNQKELGSELLGLDSGFYELNNITKGFKPGELIILAARPGMGKTTFSLNLIQAPLKKDKCVVFFSLEMPATDLINKLACSITSISLSKVTSAILDDDEATRFGDALNLISTQKLFIYDGGYLNINQLRLELKKLNQQTKVDLCVIDYIGLMTSTGAYKERHLQISELSRGLKLLARELNIPIIALAQLNRSLEARHDKRPMLSDLRESGSIEQDADMVMFVYRDEVYKIAKENEKKAQADSEGKEYSSDFIPSEIEEAEIIVGKNRNGPLGKIFLDFDKKASRFLNKEIEEIEFSG